MIKLMKYLRGVVAVIALGAMLVMGVEVYCDLKQPDLLADIVNIGIASGDSAVIWGYGKQMILFAFLGLFGGAMSSFLSAIAGIKMGERMRAAVFGKVQSLSFKEVDKFKTSSLITRLTNDVTQVQNMTVMGLKMVVRAPMTCIGGIIMASRRSMELSTIIVVAIPVIFVVVGIIVAITFPLFKVMQQRTDKVNLVMRENLLGARVIKAFTMEPDQRKRFEGANGDLRAISMMALNRMIILFPLIMVILNAATVAVFWFGGTLASQNAIETGDIMAFANYMMQILMSLIMVMMIFFNISRAKASADRINEVLETQTSILEAQLPEVPTNFDVEFKDVSFRYYESAEDVIKHMNFCIKQGEKVGVIGTTGSGKSTLVNLIPRLYDVTEGNITIGGIDVKDMSSEVLRHDVGIVLQESIMFEGTILSNLIFGNDGASEEEIARAVRIAQAKEFIDARENGLESTVEQRGKNLSGGQKQRLSIARTLLMKPKILILDDSSSALDVTTSAKLQEAIYSEMNECTLIEVAQRIATVMKLDRIIVLNNDGSLSDMGTHEELLERNEIYRSIAVSQLGEEVLCNG